METIEENFCKPILSREILDSRSLSNLFLVISANQYIYIYKEFADQHRRTFTLSTMSIKIILFFYSQTYLHLFNYQSLLAYVSYI